MRKISIFVLASFLFVTSSCYKKISQEEAKSIADSVACGYFKEVSKSCDNIFADSISIDEDGFILFHYTIEMDPEYFIGVIVHDSGSYEISIWDKR